MSSAILDRDALWCRIHTITGIQEKYAMNVIFITVFFSKYNSQNHFCKDFETLKTMVYLSS